MDYSSIRCTKSSFFSSEKLDLNKALFWRGLGKPTLPLPEVLPGCCRAVTQKESTFQTHIGPFIFFSCSSNFWTGVRCADGVGRRNRGSPFGHWSGKATSGAFSDFLFPGSSNHLEEEVQVCFLCLENSCVNLLFLLTVEKAPS